MTKDDILEAAALIFSQKGFHATSMQDIAQAVNLQKASLYHHVDSKQEILLALLNQALGLLTDRMQAVMELQIPSDQKLRQAMRVYLTTLLEHRDLASVLLLEHRSLEPELHADHIPRRDRLERLWRDLIQEGADSGLYTCADTGMAGRALLGVMNWAITWFRQDGPLSAEQIAEQFANLFLLGLVRRDTGV
ncbi:MAG: TetR/AcrR family transcriptional regulator [Chloroflexota bacterium]